MAKKKASPSPLLESPETSKRPTEHDRIKHLEHVYNRLHERLEKLTMTAADLQAAVDTLTAAVSKVSAEVAALKAIPPVVQNVEQAQLDANTAAITAATATLNAM